MKITRTELFASLPAEWPESLLPEIQSRRAETGDKIVVLDDDPTGTQTVHSIPVLTEWSVPSLLKELESDYPAFYLLTNSRSYPLAEAQRINTEIGRNLQAAAALSEVPFEVVSRSDSTLRGHFPGEVEALMAALQLDPPPPILVIPFFEEGGRFTIEDVHYVAEGEYLTPTAETTYAQDAAFGYQASNLRAWVAEKTQGRFPAQAVASVSLADLRRGGPERVGEILLSLGQPSACVVNAASYRDVEVLVLGLLRARAQGARFVYRTAASFVRVLAGMAPRALLTKDDLVVENGHGGLFVVGSYVPKTTAQLTALIQETPIEAVEIRVAELLADDRQPQEIGRVSAHINAGIRGGQDVVVFSSRQLVTGDDSASSLAIGQRVSDSLIQVLRNLAVQPRYLVAKGGITASDAATKGLQVRRALVRGQILPGVPVWELGTESRYPGMSYIVFPGNVGEAHALAKIRQDLAGNKLTE